VNGRIIYLRAPIRNVSFVIDIVMISMGRSCPNMNEHTPAGRRYLLFAQSRNCRIERVRDSVCVNDLCGKKCLVEGTSNLRAIVVTHRPEDM
jgi:hypothetical protein